jgi:predicted GH43/DUF377 family glycosyl hydrolase
MAKKRLKPRKRLKKTAPQRKVVKRTGRKAEKNQQSSPLKFVRAKENPIISPKPENNWEAWQTFNPGVILLENKVHFIYRAIGGDGISRLGYAASDDGFTISERLPCPIYEHQLTKPVFNCYSFLSGGSFGGSEDPRVVRPGGEDRLYMIYTACDQGLRVALTSIKINDFLKKKWEWRPAVLISPPGEVHKNWVLFPEKINGKYAILHSISPEIAIAYRDNLEFQPGEYLQSYYDGNGQKGSCWESWVRGAGAPPLKTREGWLLFYHAIDKRDPGKYKVGAMLLDLDDPTKVLFRCQGPVLEPEKDYENNGFKAGVVYVSGAVVKNRELLVYYGASDSYISVARAGLEGFLNGLIGRARPKLKAKILKRKKQARQYSFQCQTP